MNLKETKIQPDNKFSQSHNSIYIFELIKGKLNRSKSKLHCLSMKNMQQKYSTVLIYAAFSLHAAFPLQLPCDGCLAEQTRVVHH